MSDSIQDKPSDNIDDSSAVPTLDALHRLCDEDTAKNLTTMRCPRCPSMILRPQIATLAEKRFQLPAIKKKNGEASLPGGEIVTKFWLVTEMMAFENIGFTKTVDNTKYLICADCEIGPIGIHETKDPNKFYLATDRVKYDV